MTVARGEDVDKSGGKDTQGRSSMEPRGIADQEDNNNNITAVAVGVSLDDPGSKDKLGKDSREPRRSDDLMELSEEDKEVNNNQEPAAEKGKGEDTTEHGGNDFQQVSDIEIDDELLHEPDD